MKKYLSEEYLRIISQKNHLFIHLQSNRMQDILLQVTSRMDNSSLQVLSKTYLWNYIRNFASDQLFWKLRTQHLISRDLDLVESNWKNIYYSLAKALRNGTPFDDISTASVISIKILLSLNYHPSDHGTKIILRAASSNHSETLKLLLSDERIYPELEYGDPEVDPLDQACISGHSDVVQVLLLDGRFEPDSNMLAAAICDGCAEVVRLLLRDQRMDPTPYSYVLLEACRSGHIEVVRLLLEDGRMDPTSNSNSSIIAAAREGCDDIVKLLMLDERVESSEDEWMSKVFNIFCERGSVDILGHLLDEKIDHMKGFKIAVLGEQIEVAQLLIERFNIKITEKILLLLMKINHTRMICFILKQVDHESLHTIHGMLQLASVRGHTELVKCILSDKRLNLSSSELISDCHLTRRSEITDLLLQDKRMNLDELASSPDFKELLRTSFPLIRRRALGFYNSGYKAIEVLSLVRLLILRRQKFEDILRWMKEHPSKEMTLASRSMSDEELIDHESPIFTAYRGFFLLATPGHNLKIIRQLLREEGARKQGIDLASGLIGAFLGESLEKDSRFDYLDVYELLK